MDYMILAGASIVLLAIVQGWRRLYPQPLQGMPHNVESTNSIYGDIPFIRAAYKKLGDFSTFRNDMCKKLSSPIVQLFIGPSLSLIWVDDARETQDILLRRNKDFDRAVITSAVLRVLFPQSTIVKKTTPEWKAQRKLWQDTMAPEFLKRIVAPNLFTAGSELVELWKTKAKISEGGLVDILHDFDCAALDAIWIAILGEPLGGLRSKINDAQGVKSTTARGMDMMKTMHYVSQTAITYRTSLVPSLALWLLKRGKEYRSYQKLKEDAITKAMQGSIQRFEDAVALGIEAPDGCAMDLVLRREVQAAHKAGRPLPDLTKEVELRDEIFLLLWAGHDTTSNTLSWWIKYMSRYQNVQSTLRERLLVAFPGASTPSVDEIIQADVPYLDATIEEALRLSATVAYARQATRDTEVLGHKIPKGTTLAFNVNLDHRPIAIDETLRSASSREAFEKMRSPGMDGPAGDRLKEFAPERWLVESKDGKMVFDAYALPRVAFGDGIRGCFGKRLAMLELKIMITLITLNFKMLPLPGEKDNMNVWETLFRKPRDCWAKLETL